MKNKEIEEKAEILASRIRERIAMNQEDVEWLASQIAFFGVDVKFKIMKIG